MRHKFNKLKKILKNQSAIRRLIESYFLFQEHSDKTSFGSITKTDELGIQKAVKHANGYSGAIIEIGTLFGHTTNLIASLKNKEKKLIAVENYEWNPFSLPKEAHQLFLKRTLRYLVDNCNVEIYEGDVEEFYEKNNDTSISMVFIDAGHDYKSVLRDIDWALNIGCKVISGHDYTDLHPGVIKAVNERFGTMFETYGSVWIHTSK